jgi:hypothetical protein
MITVHEPEMAFIDTVATSILQSLIATTDDRSAKNTQCMVESSYHIAVQMLSTKKQQFKITNEAAEADVCFSSEPVARPALQEKPVAKPDMYLDTAKEEKEIVAAAEAPPLVIKKKRGRPKKNAS